MSTPFWAQSGFGLSVQQAANLLKRAQRQQASSLLNTDLQTALAFGGNWFSYQIGKKK